MEELAIGSDGTAHTVRGTAAGKLELLAISVKDGTSKWKLEVPDGVVTEPVLGKDGRLFLAVLDSPKSKLLVIKSDLVSARLETTVQLDTDMLSVPQIAPDETGAAYVVYVTGWKMGRFIWGDDGDTAAAGERYLYTFWPDGRLKFKVKLSEAQVGLAPRQ
jgi:hypothetical protein